MLPVGDGSELRRPPVATYGLMAISVAVSVWLIARAPDGVNQVQAFGFAPTAATPATFLCSLFLYGSPWTLALALLTLYVFGKHVEETIGRASYCLLYVTSAAIVLGAYYFVLPVAEQRTSAATAGVATILLTYLILFPARQIKCLYWVWFWDGQFYVPAWTLITGWWVVEAIRGYANFAATHETPLAHWLSFLTLVLAPALAFPLRGMATRVGLLEAEPMPVPDRFDSGPSPAPVSDAAAPAAPSDSAPFIEPNQVREIESALKDQKLSQAIKVYERYAGPEFDPGLDPGTRFRLAEACLNKGRYWRAVTLLEGLLGTGTPQRLQMKAHTILAAVYGQHPYFYNDARPHLDLAMAQLPKGSAARGVLLDVDKKIESADRQHLVVGESDRFCLVRLTSEAYRIADAGPIIADRLNRNLASVMRDLRNSRGILAWKLSRDEAFDLAALLGHSGIQVGIVPLTALPKYEKVLPAENAQIFPQGLKLTVTGQNIQVPWDNLALVSGGYLVLTSAQRQKVYEEARDAALADGEAMASFDTMTRELRHLTLVDFWLKEPRAHYRLREHPTRMPEAQLKALIEHLLTQAPRVPHNEGLESVAKGIVAPDCLFDRRDDFTYDGVWRLHLQEWDTLPAVSHSLFHNLLLALRELH